MSILKSTNTGIYNMHLTKDTMINYGWRKMYSDPCFEKSSSIGFIVLEYKYRDSFSEDIYLKTTIYGKDYSVKTIGELINFEKNFDIYTKPNIKNECIK